MRFAVDAQQMLVAREDWPAALLELPACKPQWAAVASLGSLMLAEGKKAHKRGSSKNWLVRRGNPAYGHRDAHCRGSNAVV